MSDLWVTPQDFFDKLAREFNFTLDVCATAENAKCAKFYTRADDGLVQDWATEGSVWMNPPYGREIGLWMARAHTVSEMGGLVVALIPNRSNAPWWHDYVMKAAEIRFVRSKLAFEGEADGVPFWGSVVVVFRRHLGPPLVSSFIQPKHECK